VLLGSVACITASAAESAGSAASQEAPHRFETTHQGTFGGTRMRYQAIVEEHFIKDDAGQRTASVYTISYLRSDAKADAAQRPVIFAFNGGPGSSSVWLHLGLLGPARVEAGEPSKPNTVAPFRYVDNPDSPLDVADIVLIDPPGTGYSRILPAGKPEQFLSTDADARMTVDLMRDWLKDHGRLNSPRYIISESYGTIRAAVVAKMLAGGPIVTGRMEGIALNGVILLGQSMDMSNDSSDRPVLTALPTLAAVACYHHKVQPGCTAAAQADAARKLARESLLPALYDGYRIDPANRAQLAGQIAELIGVDQQAVLDANLRVSPGDFAQQLLKKDGNQTRAPHVGARGRGLDPVADDPASGPVRAGVRRRGRLPAQGLGIDLPLQYEAIAFSDVNFADYGAGVGVPSGKNFALDLATAANHNPALRVMVGAGYYDLVTTIGTAEYTLAHSGIPADRTEFHYYESGHMPYLGAATRSEVARDLRLFVTAAPQRAATCAMCPRALRPLAVATAPRDVGDRRDDALLGPFERREGRASRRAARRPCPRHRLRRQRQRTRPGDQGAHGARRAGQVAWTIDGHSPMGGAVHEVCRKDASSPTSQADHGEGRSCAKALHRQ
jgi:carboxypeptidase C (cathepsin A)